MKQEMLHIPNGCLTGTTAPASNSCKNIGTFLLATCGLTPVSAEYDYDTSR